MSMNYLDVVKNIRKKRNELETYWWPNLLDFPKFFTNDYSTCYKLGNDLVYEINVPGFSKNDISVVLDKGILSISGKRKVDIEDYNGTTEFNMSYDIGTSEIEAELKDGILYIKLKRSQEDSAKTINIK